MARRSFIFLLLLGLYLTTRGYHSREVDQAYRLHLLLHARNPSIFADDPFVKAFDVFNPHRGYLAMLDAASRPLGLSLGILTLYLATFGATAAGVDRLTRAVWEDRSPDVGILAFGLVLAARAGNIGTNHLFDGMLLDRLVALALGWNAFAEAARDRRPAVVAALIGVAGLIHPSMGLQMGMVLAGSMVVWNLAERGSRRDLALGLGLLFAGLLPSVWLMSGQSARLLDGLPPDEFRRLSAELQSPQHMIPSLWRKPQWYAWFCYLALAIPWGTDRAWSRARRRISTTLVLVVIGLGFAAAAIELLKDVRVTIFQPFRMAMVARGLALVLVSDRLLELWKRGDLLGRVRAALIVTGLAGDWSLTVVTSAETVASLLESLLKRPRLVAAAHAILIGGGLVFLARHDTEQGQWALLLAIVGASVWSLFVRSRRLEWNRRRAVLAFASVWCVPILAFALPPIVGVESGSKVVESLARRCRFWPVPLDDVEKLAVWSRDHTPPEARFVGPPAPKNFRLFSLRSVAFNRAGSPYHAAGLADWAERFKDHVGFAGSNADFVAAYLGDRQRLEAGFARKSEHELAELARRQNADHVLAASNLTTSGELERLRTEGRYAVYRVAPTAQARAEAASPTRR